MITEPPGIFLNFFKNSSGQNYVSHGISLHLYDCCVIFPSASNIHFVQSSKCFR